MALEEDSRTLLAEEGQPQDQPAEPSSAARRFGLIASTSLFAVVLLAFGARSTHAEQPATPVAAEAPFVKLADAGTCMPKCPARRLNDVDAMENFITGGKTDGKTDGSSESMYDLTEEQQACFQDCPSQGYLAQRTFEFCTADCLRKSTASIAQKDEIPDGKSPMQLCIEKCPTDGNLWRLQYESCALACEEDEADSQAEFEKKWPLAKKGSEDAKLASKDIKVVAQLIKKFEIVERPKRPPALVFELFKTAIQNSLQKVLGTADGEVDVTLRMVKEERRLSTQVFETYPGDVFEAVAEITDCSKDVINKFASGGIAESIDTEIAAEIEADSLIRDAAEIFPSVISETTTVSVEGNYMSMGFNAVCRANEGDTTPDDFGKATAFYGKSLRQCSQICEGMQSQCHGFEYRTSEKRCEIWKDPICSSSQFQAIDGTTSKEDFRCFRKCTMEEE